MVCGEYGCPSFAQLLRFLHTLYTVHQCFPLETLPRLDYLGRHLARLFKPRMGGGRSRSQDDIRSGAGSPERCHRLRGSHLCEPRGHLKDLAPSTRNQFEFCVRFCVGQLGGD